MENVQVEIQCVRCRESHRLSYPNPQEILEDQLLRPVDTSRAAFWCKFCGCVFPCERQYVRRTDVQMLDQNQNHLDGIGYRIAFRCGQENCEAPVIVHTVRDVETSNGELRFQAVSRKVAASCQLNHTPTLINANTELLIVQVGGFEIANVHSL